MVVIIGIMVLSITELVSFMLLEVKTNFTVPSKDGRTRIYLLLGFPFRVSVIIHILNLVFEQWVDTLFKNLDVRITWISELSYRTVSKNWLLFAALGLIHYHEVTHTTQCIFHRFYIQNIGQKKEWRPAYLQYMDWTPSNTELVAVEIIFHQASMEEHERDSI